MAMMVNRRITQLRSQNEIEEASQVMTLDILRDKSMDDKLFQPYVRLGSFYIGMGLGFLSQKISYKFRIFPKEQSPIGKAVTEILSFRRTDRQTSFYFLLEINKLVYRTSVLLGIEAKLLYIQTEYRPYVVFRRSRQPRKIYNYFQEDGVETIDMMALREIGNL